MSIIERIKSWFSKLAFWRQRPSGGASSETTNEQTTAGAPVSDSQGEVGGTTPIPATEQPPTYLDVGMMYGLEDPQAFRRPRVEVWPLQPHECIEVRLEAADGRVWVNTPPMGGYARKTNPEAHATGFKLKGSVASTPSYVDTMPNPITVVVVNTRVGTLRFGGVNPTNQACFYQRVEVR